MKKLSFSGCDITSNDLNKVTDVLKSGWLAHGEYSKLFEEEFANYLNIRKSSTVASCTAGLFILAKLAGFGPKDEVIVPAMTHTATAHAIAYTGAKIKFVDVDYETGNISLSSLKKKYNNNTTGIVIVHLLGRSAWTKEFDDFVKNKKITVIEDCAHSLGTLNYDGTHVGTKGFGGSFSFYPTKQITTGEGGMIVSNNSKIVDESKRFRAFGINSDPQDRKIPGVYDVNDLGFNFRMTEFQAVLGYTQIKRYKKNLEHRTNISKRYYNNLKNVTGIVLPRINSKDSYFVFQFLLDNKKINRNDFIKKLKAIDIPATIHYANPLHKMSYYKNKNKLIKLKNSEKYAENCLSLPVHKNISENVCDYICGEIIKLL